MEYLVVILPIRCQHAIIRLVKTVAGAFADHLRSQQPVKLLIT